MFLPSRSRAACTVLVAAALTLPLAPARAHTTAELRSAGGYQSMPIASDITEVELVEQTQGACRFNRSWGYDPTNRELWVNAGCGGRFKLVKAEAEDSRSSNATAAAVAVAAIAGIAILASANRDRPDTTPAPQPAAGYGQPIRSQRGMCLDVADGRLRPGAAVQLYACHGRENQRFYWGRSGEIVTANQLCLDIEHANPKDGARLRRPAFPPAWAACREAWLGLCLALGLALAGTTAAQPAAPRPPSTTTAALAADAPGAAPAPRAGGGSGAEQACRAADHDHDGFISLEEYHRDIARSWAALGPDATGHVRLDDLAAVPGLRRSVLERLRRADSDGDGRLSFKEVVSARMAQFDAADLDRDDRLSMKECVDHERKLAATLRTERPRKAP